MWKVMRIAALAVLGLSGVLYACSIPAAQFNETVEARYPAIGQFVDLDGQRIHYDRRGTGPAVVLIHGASGNLRDFTFSISDALAEAGFTAIAVDRPGFGYSDRAEGETFTPSSQAAVLRRAMAEIGVEKPIVVGHSFGGAVAAAWTVDAPEAIAGSVIVSGVTYPWPARRGQRRGVGVPATICAFGLCRLHRGRTRLAARDISRERARHYQCERGDGGSVPALSRNPGPGRVDPWHSG
jgi:pimeloyl-ACP methyl ester carboxylesterase